MFKGTVYTGPITITSYYTLSEMPVFVLSGCTIPMLVDSTPPTGQAQIIPSSLKLVIFPLLGDSQRKSRLYEDDGKSNSYLNDEYAWTEFVYMLPAQDSIIFVISPSEGSYNGFPLYRSYQLVFKGIYPAVDNGVSVNGVSIPYSPFALTPTYDSWTYDGSSLSLIINLNSNYSVLSPISISLSLIGNIDDPLLSQGFEGLMNRLEAAKELLDDQWGTIYTVYQDDYKALLLATENGMRVTNNITNIIQELQNLSSLIQLTISEVSSLVVPPNVQSELLSLLTLM